MRLLACAVALALPSAAFAGNPWEELMGPGKPQLWTDPQGRFFLDLPVGWVAEPRRGAEHLVDFTKTHGDYGYVGRVTVEMRSVPPGVKAAHYASRVEEEWKKRAPGFRILEADRTQVSGLSAVRRYFTYRERNNAELTNEAVQLIFLAGERAFIVTLETAAGAKAVFYEDFEKMLRGFGARAPGEEGLPMPKAKKKIKAGEMINPDATPY